MTVCSFVVYDSDNEIQPKNQNGLGCVFIANDERRGISRFLDTEFQMTVYRLDKEFVFPDPALADPNGLLAVGGDLELDRILMAYSLGILPWYSEGQPILWWSPDPRLILLPEQVHVSKSLKRVIKSGKFTIRYDTCFERVIRHCGEVTRPGQDGTWITEEMIEAYCRLHLKGYTHSVESFFEEELVGGLYGISLGNSFFGESMFSLKPDASKAALVDLSETLQNRGFDFIDCQIPTNHLTSMGAFKISRNEFLVKLHEAMGKQTLVGNWTNI